jgi:hypothetical protein
MNLKTGAACARDAYYAPPLFTPDLERDHQGVDAMNYTERTGAASNHFAAQVGVRPASPTPARIGSPQHVARGVGGNFLGRDGAEPVTTHILFGKPHFFAKIQLERLSESNLK